MSFFSSPMSNAANVGGAVPITWPPTVSASLIADWRADMGVTGTNPVTAVTDQSSSHNNLSSNNTAVNPNIISVSNAFMSHPTLRFQNSQYFNHSVNATNGCTIAFVAQNTTGATGPNQGMAALGGTFGFNVFSANSNISYRWSLRIGSNQFITSSYTIINQPTAAVAVVSAANNITLYTDIHPGENFTSGSSLGNGNNTFLGFSATDPYNQDLYHFAIFNGAVNSSDANKIITALKNTWGV